MADPTVAHRDQIHRLLVERGAGLICAHSSTGMLLFANPAAAEQLGYQPEELVGTPLRSLLHPAVRSRFDAYLERVWARGQDRGLMKLTARDGSGVVWAYHNVRYEPPEGKPIVLVHAHDVTGEKWTEREIREREHVHCRTFIATSRDGICRIEFERDPLVERLEAEAMEQRLLDDLARWGYVAECNDAFARMYAAGSASEMTGVPLRNLPLLKELRETDGSRRLIENGFAATELVCHELDVEGNPRDFSVSVAGVVEEGSLRCLWVHLRDDTERRRIEARAEKDRRLLRLVERVLAARDGGDPEIVAEEICEQIAEQGSG